MAVALALIALAGCGYLAFAYLRARRFDTRVPLADSGVAVTVFKPLYGLDPGLFENLRSFCEQEYSNFSILFCVRDANDPAIPVVKRVMDAYPQVDCRLIVDDRSSARNPKVANMMGALSAARGEIFVIADSDVRAPRDLLRAVAAAFESPRTGAASCVYRGEPLGGNLPTQLGALHINDHFLPSVLVATAGAPPGFCLGAVMAVRRAAFDEIGGFEAIGRYLGDDFALGMLSAAKGWRVELIARTVSCMVHEPSLAALFAHHLRWARTIRTQAALGYAFLFVTYPLPFAIASVVAARGALWSIGVLALTAAARVVLRGALRARFSLDRGGSPVVMLASDAFELITWAYAFFGSAVEWRGDRYRA